MQKLTKSALLGCIMLVISCSGDHSQKKIEMIPVKTMEVHVQDACNIKSYVGTAEETKSARVGCRYPGTLVSLNVKKGDYVREGSVIALVSSQSVMTTKEIADATLKQAMDGYERIRSMHEKGSIADVKMVEIETQLAKAKAAAAAADKAVEECSIKAPFSGIVGEIYADEGVELDLLQDIVKIMDISSMEIKFSVPETELSMIKEGDLTSINVPALNLESAKAEIINKGISAAPLSHTYSCTLRPLEKINGLMPGMVCKVYLESTQGEGIIIPSSVIRTDEKGRYVWTVQNQIVSKKYIEPKGYSEKGVIVQEGLENGDQIITEGVQKVCSGMKVSIVK